jgi:DNA mismatch repair protein MutL
MNRIKVLSENVTNRIAAGEVIERPVSVVKELVENSLDAGATTIFIKIEKGGKELIQVVDDGHGMSSDDALLCLERHATSKIRNVDDIIHINTLGFRGEAIPSIASISRFNLITLDSDSDIATDIYIEGGTLKDVRKTAANRGTSISVRKIFYNIPARRKFLKSDLVEFRHILNYVHYQSILYPNVTFKLVANGREKLNYPAVNNYKKRVKEVFGKSFDNQDFVEVGYNIGKLHISGYISGLEEFHKGYEKFKYLFINGRYINDKIVIKAIKTAYQPFMAKVRSMQQGTVPPFILFIEIEPELIDINVHPAKREVRFRDTHLVFDAVKNAVTSKLNQIQEERFQQIKDRFGSGFANSAREFTQNQHNNIQHEARDSYPRESLIKSNYSKSKPILQKNTNVINSSRNNSSGDGIDFMSYQKETTPKFSTYKKEFKEVVQPSIFDAETEAPETTEEEMVKNIRKHHDLPVKSEIEAVNPWQFQNTFIFIQIGEELIIIDQHAAHERILYEKIMDRIKGEEPETQKLLFPIVLDLPNYITSTVKELIEENLEIFYNIGFSVKTFSGNSLVIDEIPVELEEWGGGDIFLEILQQLDEEYEETEDFRDSIAKSVSCKAAIKAGKKLTAKEMIKLISDLFGCKVPYYCPHGRPLIIKQTADDFKKKFKRII